MRQDLTKVTIDFETYYNKDYSLKKMSMPEYVQDKRFQILGVALTSEDHGSPMFIRASNATGNVGIRVALGQIDWSRTLVIAHNAFFEGSILEWVLGFKPAAYFCTMMGSRPFVTPFTGSSSLASCCEHFMLPSKGDAISKMQGKTPRSLSNTEWGELEDYCTRDVVLSRAIYHKTVGRLPSEEQTLIDLTVKKYVRPRLQLDDARLVRAISDVETSRALQALKLAAHGFRTSDVTSNVKLISHLRSFGVTPPVKMSPTTNRVTYATAKRDPEFMGLLKHPNEKVRVLIEARLALKSNIELTRTQKFQEISKVMNGYLPVPLMYYGAHTGRFSGAMGINLQNLPRGSSLRQAVVAKPGHVLLSVDLKAIEARITACLAQQADLVQQFANNEDVYSNFATDLYGYPVSDCDETKEERFIGKMCILGLGFGMGHNKYLDTMRSFGIEMDLATAATTVRKYRARFPAINRAWTELEAMIGAMRTLRGDSYMSYGPVKFTAGKLILPNDMPIYYNRLSKNPVSFKNEYTSFNGPNSPYQKPLWGGALLENIVQALARIVISRAEVRLAEKGLEAVLQVHDELVYSVPEDKASTIALLIKRVVTDPVPWMPDLPLDCSIGIGSSYGDAK